MVSAIKGCEQANLLIAGRGVDPGATLERNRDGRSVEVRSTKAAARERRVDLRSPEVEDRGGGTGRHGRRPFGQSR